MVWSTITADGQWHRTSAISRDEWVATGWSGERDIRLDFNLASPNTGVCYYDDICLIDLTEKFGSGIRCVTNSPSGNTFSGFKLQRYNGGTYVDQPYGGISALGKQTLTFKKENGVNQIRLGLNGSTHDCTYRLDISG